MTQELAVPDNTTDYSTIGSGDPIMLVNIQRSECADVNFEFLIPGTDEVKRSFKPWIPSMIIELRLVHLNLTTPVLSFCPVGNCLMGNLHFFTLDHGGKLFIEKI